MTPKLSQGRHYLAIPGPSVIPDAVLQAMHRPAPNIYKGELVDLVEGLFPDLCKVGRTSHHVAIYIANGHGVWEAALANTLAHGDKVLVLATGTFGHGWGDVAEGLGARPQVLDFGNRSDIDMSRVSEALKADVNHEIRAVLAVHVDTATSARNDIAALGCLIADLGHPALLMVDCIASLGCDRFEMDDWRVDVMVTGCQKGLMTPPGMGFVYFNDKAAAARDRANCVTPYWDWKRRVDPHVFYEYFFGTAPTHHLYGLRQALDMILTEGMQNVWHRHEVLANAIWRAIDIWSEGGSMEFNMADPAKRSHAVTSLRMTAPFATQLREWAEDQAGLTLGIGLGLAPSNSPQSHGFFRIGHMGHVNAQMIMSVVGTIDTGLKALNIPHGSGATEAATQYIADQQSA